MYHLPIGGGLNYIEVVLKQSDAEQPVMVGWLLLRGNSQPGMIRIECLGHRAACQSDCSIEVKATTKPTAVKLWQATNPKTRDFRLEIIGPAWKSSALSEQGSGAYIAKVPKPEKGWTAFFAELTFDSGGPIPYKFTTQVSVIPKTLPFADKLSFDSNTHSDSVSLAANR